MSLSKPTFIKTKPLKYYTTTKNLSSSFIDAFIHMLSAKKMELDEVLEISLSLVGQLTQVDISKFYYELCRDPEIVNLNMQQMEDLKNDFMPPKLDEMSQILNGVFLLLMIGKRIDLQFCSEYMLARAKAIYSILDKQWEEKALDKVITPEKLKILSDAFSRTQGMRCVICVFIVHMARSMSSDQPIYKYIADMLEYSQLSGFYLIYYILICDSGHPIMRDSYLTMDTMKFIEAYDLWNQYPDSYRKYMGLMADKETLSAMGGHPLRRLTYIAIQVASRRDPSIKNLKHIVPADSDKLDLLIKRYFPENKHVLNSLNISKLIAPTTITSASRKHLEDVIRASGSSFLKNAFDITLEKDKESEKYKVKTQDSISFKALQSFSTEAGGPLVEESNLDEPEESDEV